jgi:hypothetical protein
VFDSRTIPLVPDKKFVLKLSSPKERPQRTQIVIADSEAVRRDRRYRWRLALESPKAGAAAAGCGHVGYILCDPVSHLRAFDNLGFRIPKEIPSGYGILVLDSQAQRFGGRLLGSSFCNGFLQSPACG